jgi:hypothetical protein
LECPQSILLNEDVGIPRVNGKAEPKGVHGTGAVFYLMLRTGTTEDKR